MRFDPPLVPARLERRYKRFLADIVWEDGRKETVHVANPGGMLGLATPGARVYLSDSQNPARKLRWSWELVAVDDALVMVNTSRPNAIVREGLEAGSLPAFGDFDSLAAEVPYGEEGSRVDFLLTRRRTRRFLEVKSVTLAADGVGYFPDAVTARGLRHLRELARMARRHSRRGALCFLVCRGDVDRVRPAEAIDPSYAVGLREAAAAGVEIAAYRADISLSGVRVGARLPVELDSGDPGPTRDRW